MLKTWSVKTAGTAASATQGLTFPFSNSPSSLKDVSEVRKCCHQTVLGQLRPPDCWETPPVWGFTSNTCPGPPIQKGSRPPSHKDSTKPTVQNEDSTAPCLGQEIPARHPEHIQRLSLQMGLQGTLRELGYKHLCKYQRSPCEHTMSKRTSSDKLLHKLQGGMHISRRSNNKLERNKTFIPVTYETSQLSSLTSAT